MYKLSLIKIKSINFIPSKENKPHHFVFSAVQLSSEFYKYDFSDQHMQTVLVISVPYTLIYYYLLLLNF